MRGWKGCKKKECGDEPRLKWRRVKFYKGEVSSEKPCDDDDDGMETEAERKGKETKDEEEISKCLSTDTW